MGPGGRTRARWRPAWIMRAVLLLALAAALPSHCLSNILGVVSSNANLTYLASALANTGVGALLEDASQSFTLFAPSDSAFQMATSFGSLQCTTNYYSTSQCTSLPQLMASTDLGQLLQNHVVSGVFDASALVNGTLLQFVGSAVQQVLTLQNGQLWLGNAPVVQTNIVAANGVMHVLGAFITTDLSFNETAITTASKLGDFGPFDLDKRNQFFSSESLSLPTNIPSLTASYESVRQLVDLPQGGLANPMAITYSPAAMYQLLRASPAAGYEDSEAVQAVSPSGGPAAAPNLVPLAPASAATINIGTVSGAASGAAPQPASNNSVNGSVATYSVSTQPEAQTIQAPPPLKYGEQDTVVSQARKWNHLIPEGVERPDDNDTLAYMTVLELASLIRSRQVTSVELVEIYTERLQRYDSVLEAVVTYTTPLGMQQAQAADALLKQGTYLGPLHGIPYGLKDIIAVSGYPTTWGAPEFRNQFIDEDAIVYQNLRKAGAVLIAKLATGEMAYDDVWWGGKVKNPWNIAEGSSGSSAGPAASVTAATVAFSVGTETEGSLMSPAATCGTTAMRPSFGSVGRSWIMTLADSLDKPGPICRAVADCSLIFDIIRGQDPLDPSSRDVALQDPTRVDLTQLTVGYLPGTEYAAPEMLDVLGARGVTLVPFNLDYGVNAEDVILNIMICETAAHFDYWQRSGQDDQNRRQDYWPPLLRLARLIPAVEYIQAQRARTQLVMQVLRLMQAAGIDAFIANSTTDLAMSNLVGLPTLSVPIGYAPISGSENSTRRNPVTAGIFGWPDGEPEIIALGIAWQNETSYHLQQPPIDDVEPYILAECIPYSRCSLPAAALGPATAPNITIASPSSPNPPVADSG